MGKTVLITLISISFAGYTYGQTLDKYEVWGWDGSIEEFARIYSDSTGKDLRYGYACMADSCDAIGDIVYAAVFTEDIEGYRSGNLDWASTERLTIVKDWNDREWTLRSPDSITIVTIGELLLSLEKLDSVQVGNYFQDHQSDLHTILTGTFSEDLLTRFRCLGILKKASNLTLQANEKNFEILADMLSFPDPNSCYLAMAIIQNSGFPDAEKINRKLFAKKALTLVNFLNSNLQNYQSDAITFLNNTYSRRSLTSPNEWVSWIRSY